MIYIGISIEKLNNNIFYILLLIIPYYDQE